MSKNTNLKTRSIWIDQVFWFGEVAIKTAALMMIGHFIFSIVKEFV